MSDLLALAREFDLPPKWDGRPVEWSEWDDTPIFVCDRSTSKPITCGGCGSTASPLTAAGTVFPVEGDTFERDRVKRTKSGREYVSGTVTVAARPLLCLHVARCRDCRVDTVYDTRTNECWDLDDTDYGPEGSHAP